MDASGCARRFPSNYLQCVGRIVRRDYWDPFEFALAMGYLAGDSWANRHCIIQTAGLSYTNTALAIVNGCGMATTDQWFWGLGWDPAKPNPVFAWMANYGPPFTFYDLRNLAVHWVYTAAPPYPNVVISHTEGAGDGFIWGSAPWLNAI